MANFFKRGTRTFEAKKKKQYDEEYEINRAYPRSDKNYGYIRSEHRTDVGKNKGKARSSLVLTLMTSTHLRGPYERRKRSMIQQGGKVWFIKNFQVNPPGTNRVWEGGTKA